MEILEMKEKASRAALFSLMRPSSKTCVAAVSPGHWEREKERAFALSEHWI